MIALLQRVSSAQVAVAGEVIGAIGGGLCVFAAAERGDGEAQAVRLAERIAGYRVFADAAGRMNASVCDSGGAILLVPQFTLAADTRKGRRASFTPVAPPAEGEPLVARLAAELRAMGTTVATGRFGADMQVSLTNDGPVTFHLRVAPTG